MSWQDADKISEQLGNGWRLPSLNELILMRNIIGQGSTNDIGEFTEGLYWSSTSHSDSRMARLLRFSDGNTSYYYSKTSPNRNYNVRAIKDINR